MIDMYDLPTTLQLAEMIRLEAEGKKMNLSRDAESELFPFWKPKLADGITDRKSYRDFKHGTGSTVVCDLTGAVKPIDAVTGKAIAAKGSRSVMDQWTDFLKGIKSGKLADKTGTVKPQKNPSVRSEKESHDWTNPVQVKSNARDGKTKVTTPVKHTVKQVTRFDTFGSVVVDSFAGAKKIAAEGLAPKAYLKMTEKKLDGSMIRRKDELGVEIKGSSAASPNPDKLVGIVKPKASDLSGKKSEKTPSAKNGAPVVSAKTYTEKLKPFGAGAYSVKESFPKIKTVTLDSKFGAVKAPKSKLFGK